MLICAFPLLSFNVSNDAGKDTEEGEKREPVVIGQPREIEYCQEQHATVDERQADMLKYLLRHPLYSDEYPHIESE